MNIENLQEHAAALRKQVQREGSMTGNGLIDFMSSRGLLGEGRCDERKLRQLAGLALYISPDHKEGATVYVTVPLVVVIPLEEQRAQQLPEAVAFIRQSLSRGPIPQDQLNFPEASFPAITLSEALRAANAALIINVGSSRSYELLPYSPS